MGLALFGLALLVVAVALCWKNSFAAFVAVVAFMLGMTTSNSHAMLAGPAQEFADWTSNSINSVATKIFGGHAR